MMHRIVPVLVVGIGVPLAVSQLLPSNSLEERSPAIPLVVLFVLGGLAGWAAPTLRGWMVTAAWVVVAAVLVLLSWTDLVLNVAPSIATVDAWRTETFIAIVGAALVVSGGFMAGALVRGRGAGARAVHLPNVLAIGVVVVACIAGAWLTATAFSTSALVLQDDPQRLTVTVTDDGLEVTPAALGSGEYRVVYESHASTPRLVASVVPLGAADGTPRAMTVSEIAQWIDGEWASMEPPFQSAASWFPIGPGERRYGGRLALSPSPDGTGGTLWYVSASDDLRSWPPILDDAELEPAPWPIDAHVVVPVADD